MIPARGLVGPVMAMARPRRPEAEREAVREAVAGSTGSAIERARRLAHAVASAALADIDRDPADHVIVLLRGLSPSPVDRLSTSAEIDTSGLIVAERLRRLRARGGRRLSERETEAEDAEVLGAVAATLSRRYRKILSAQAK